ncbi:hypothetical protein D3C81_176740 [compost metagenome]
MTLEELLTNGIPRSDGCFLRSAPKPLNADTFDILRTFVANPHAAQVAWVVGREVRQRLLNRKVLGSPKEFKLNGHVDHTGVIGQLRYGNVYGFTDDALVAADRLIAIAVDKNNNVLEYTGVWIDTDLEY